MTRQYSTAYTIEYNKLLKGQIERRMRMSIAAVASVWFTAWVNAGQTDLKNLQNTAFTDDDLKEFEALDAGWKTSSARGSMHE